MNIQEMLGDSFHEGMTIDEINAALSGKKFADLSTGNYVDRNKYNADINAKDMEIAKKTSELNARMTDSEKSAASVAADKAKIQELEAFIKNQTISNNRDRAESLTSDIRTILGISSTDADYTTLLDVLSNENSDNTKNIASYINKIVKDSYDKGQKDATKDSLGNFSNGVDKQGLGGKQEEIGAFGKQLASNSKPQVDPNLYFAKK